MRPMEETAGSVALIRDVWTSAVASCTIYQTLNSFKKLQN